MYENGLEGVYVPRTKQGHPGNVDGWNMDDRRLDIVDRAELGGNKGDITDKKNQNEKKGWYTSGRKLEENAPHSIELLKM